MIQQHFSDSEAILRIGCAMICGAAIGWERERREKAAGLRTHVFVSMGAALITIVSAFGFADAIAPGLVMLDPSRVAAQVVSGIGFLGAGIIWFNRSKVRGLDTAAGIWTTSAVGLATGGGMYVPAFAVTAAVLLMNVLLKPVEQKFFPRRKEGRLLVGITELSSLSDIHRVVEEAGIKVKGVRLANDETSGTLGLDLCGPKGLDWLAFVGKVRNLNGVHSVTFSEPNENDA